MDYAFLSWLQFAILGLAMPAFAKGVSVFCRRPAPELGRERGAQIDPGSRQDRVAQNPHEIPKRPFR